VNLEEEERGRGTVSQPYNAVAAGRRINAGCELLTQVWSPGSRDNEWAIISAKAIRLIVVSPFELLFFGVGL
jgi:hypothetical protein